MKRFPVDFIDANCFQIENIKTSELSGVFGLTFHTRSCLNSDSLGVEIGLLTPRLTFVHPPMTIHGLGSENVFRINGGSTEPYQGPIYLTIVNGETIRFP